MTEKKFVTSWLKIVSYILIGLFIILNYFSNLNENYLSSHDEAAGATIWTLIGGFIAVACGNKCSKWAYEIKKSTNAAYIVGFLFSLLGLLGYWVYYINLISKNDLYKSNFKKRLRRTKETYN